MIDTSENLIIIKGQIKTPEIESCQNHNGNYKVVFRNVPSAYTYKEENVLWLTDPDKPDPNNYQIISKGRLRNYRIMLGRESFEKYIRIFEESCRCERIES